MPWKLPEDRFREIWAGDATLNAAVPVTTDESTNRFYADGSPEWINDETKYPGQFVILEDQGDSLINTSHESETRLKGYLLQIVTKDKSLTKTLVDTYFPLLSDQLACSDSDVGSIGAYRVISEQHAKLDGGFRVYQAQIELTVRAARK